MAYLLRNVNPPGTRRGFIAASPSRANPDYFYTWIRDASLVTYTLVATQLGDNAILDHASFLTVLQDFVDFQVHTQNTMHDSPCQCLGEPKYMDNGDPFKGAWGRPQNDGPAERVITMILLANHLETIASDDITAYVQSVLKPAIYRDLDYIETHWVEPCFDLWEEIRGHHFYTWMVMRRALLDGSRFAALQGHRQGGHRYRRQARAIQDRLLSFWSKQDGYVRVTQAQLEGQAKPSGLDISVLLAANLAATLDDDFFTPSSDKILATAVAMEQRFDQVFPINHERNKTRYGVAMGRYPEDVYDGNGMSLGNPWFLATACMAELYYRAMLTWQSQGGVEVNEINHGFFLQRDTKVVTGHVYRLGQPDYQQLIQQLTTEADRFLATIQYHQQANGALSEQFNRWTGYQQGAEDLTWSYASLLSALHARQQWLAQ
ncbi:glucoamylase [Hesseltinella vesiculosa]|uniref:glucan 1,4-alpha-glucosidase n=1 Tax=Hesseltinella vesiculosa TaxID=101127 RepID=A0A1X2GQT3_9FUNG|nr:glucoamylase [Hesseltinella vesiculosa]